MMLKLIERPPFRVSNKILLLDSRRISSFILFVGGGEDIYGNGTPNPTSIVNMAVQNKNFSAISNQFSPNFASSDNSSPGSTAPRRPPRSKHDLALSVGNGCSPSSPNVTRKGMNGETNTSSIQDTLLPSKEAPSRLLIGTQMLQSNQNNKYNNLSNNSKHPPSRYQNHTNGIYNNKQNDVQMAKNMRSNVEDVS